jgi:hypothetical protein
MSSSSVCIAGVARLHDNLSMACWLSLGGHPCPPYIGRRTRLVDRSPNRLQQENLSLVDYNFCHILSICFGRNPPRSCLVRRASRSCRMRSSGESSGRSSRGHVGREPGRLGPLIGRLVRW